MPTNQENTEMPRPRREPTENVRAKSSNVAAVRQLAATERRSLVEQFDVVITAGLEALNAETH